MPRPLICQLPSQRPPGLPQLSLGMWGGLLLSPLKGPRGQRQALRAWLERSWVCRSWVGGHLSTPGPATTRVTLPSSLAGCLDPGLKNAEGCWWGKLIGNRKTWHSFSRRPGLGKQ